MAVFWAVALVMEAASNPETLVTSTRRNNPENSHLHTRRIENLKSHLVSNMSPTTDFVEEIV
jgi:hypothetical protein